MRAVLDHARRNVVAYVALFVALGGTSYAVTQLPAGSVGTNQIKNHAITPIKFDPTKIGASVRYWAIVLPGGHVFASRPRGARVLHWNPADASGMLGWGQAIPGNCFPLATVMQGGGDNGASNAGFVNVAESTGTARHAFLRFATYDAGGHPDPEITDVVLLCPQP
jgi:hypothetical protein